MRINTLIAHGVRNLAPVTLEPRERFNVFVGDNGQGKTNLLEAIYVVATLRSFRTSSLSDLVAFGREEAKLGARVVKDELTRLYEVDIGPGGRKIRVDGKPRRPAGYFGGFNVVVFTPEDLGLPRGSPGDRRKFLDRGVFNFEASFLPVASDYEKVLKSRNAILKQAGEGMPRGQVEDMLQVYDEQLARLAVQIIAARTRFLAALAPALVDTFAQITRTGLTAGARYSSKLTEVPGGAPSTAGGSSLPPGGISLDPDFIIQRLREGRARDLASQSTQLGPHRDDVVLELEGHEAGSFASQGQLRAIMLAWKTAELKILGDAHGDPPVLLLDDVSSELDPSRNELLFEHLAALAGQCFITTTSGAHVLLAKNRADYRIQNGEILQ